jgi:2-polyprenyl-3-methyl-5-hydroxy-6-metoxy-1,4-benzoquinol methylase
MKSTTLPAEKNLNEAEWAVRLFNKSVLKQRKFKEITQLLGPTQGLHCLDIGSDNGVVSLLLRQGGGTWKSADLDEGSVGAISALVKTDVFQIDGGATPFQENEFDRVVIVDFLEHIPDDRGFIQELHRILKPEGKLILNVPHLKNGLLRRLRFAIGQTDEKHGHLRPGYTRESLEAVLGDHFSLQSQHTYSRFFSELIDTLIVFAVSMLRKGKHDPSKKGNIVTGQDLKKFQSSFKLFSAIYPLVWFFSKLDHLLFFTSGYMLIGVARACDTGMKKEGYEEFSAARDR